MRFGGVITRDIGICVPSTSPVTGGLMVGSIRTHPPNPSVLSVGAAAEGVFGVAARVLT
jgi:hypothetical protein